MVSNQSKLKHSLPLLLALVVLISCLPMIPVAADQIYSLYGSWQFIGDFGSVAQDFYFDYSFYCEGTLYYGFVYYVEDDELWFFTSETDEVCVYDGGDGSGWTTGLGRPVISFADRVQVTYDEYMFFELCLTQIEDEPVVCSTSISIGDNTYEFTGTDASPLVAMTVDNDGCTLSDGVNTYQYTYSGSGTFKGFSSSAEGSVSYSIGSTWNFGGKSGVNSQYTIYPIAETSVQTYISTITIDGQKFIFTSTTEQPAVLLQVTSSGAILSYGDQTLTFTYEGDGNFLGLGYSSLMDPSYLPGESYPLAAGSHTLKSVNDGTGTGSGPFETTIVIDGSVFQFFSDTEYPLVTCYLSSNGVRLVCGDDVRMWRPKYNEEFLGLALSPNSSEPSYKLSDEWFMVRGSSTQYAFEFYSYCVESEVNDLARIFKSLATTILVPVSVFFTAEFIPGLPIGSVMLISFVVGLLFFFLKSSK